MSQYLTPAQLAERWEISTATLSNWRVRGYGPPFIKPAGTLKARVRYKIEDVTAWETANQHRNTGTCG